MKLFLSFVLAVFSTHGLAAFIPQKIVTGSRHTCAISTDGGVKCWGGNDNGQLGLGNREDHGSIPGSMGKNLPYVNLGQNVIVKDMCAGGDYSCALTSDQRLKCWGLNDQGVLGLGSGAYRVGVQPIDMGDSLPFVDLGTNFKVQSVACGYSHACAVNQDGKAKCWGSNVSGALGIESIKDHGLQADMGDKLPFVMIEDKIQSISVGREFSCALLVDGSFKCWGDNYYGNLGIESTNTVGAKAGTMGKNLQSVKLENGPYSGLAISAGYVHTCAAYVFEGSKKLKCWGYNSSGQLGVGSNSYTIGGKLSSMGENLPFVMTGIDSNSIREIRNFAAHSCVLTNSGRVKCWGYNLQGELGVGDNRSRGVSAIDMGQNLPYTDLGLPVKTLSTASMGGQMCAILINNGIKCWGRNIEGQLGYGDTLSRGFNPGEMDENLPFVILD